MYCTAITQIHIFEYDLSPVSLHSWETWKLSQKQNSLGPNPSWPWSWKFNLRLWWSIPQGKPPRADTVQLVKIEPMMRQNHNWSNFRAEILDVQVSTPGFPPHLFFRWKIAFLWNIAKSFGGSTYTVTQRLGFIGRIPLWYWFPVHSQNQFTANCAYLPVICIILIEWYCQYCIASCWDFCGNTFCMDIYYSMSLSPK